MRDERRDVLGAARTVQRGTAAQAFAHPALRVAETADDGEALRQRRDRIVAVAGRTRMPQDELLRFGHGRGGLRVVAPEMVCEPELAERLREQDLVLSAERAPPGDRFGVELPRGSEAARMAA